MTEQQTTPVAQNSGDDSEPAQAPTRAHSKRSRSKRQQQKLQRDKQRSDQHANCFVGFRITTPSIIAHAEELQQSLARAFPGVASCLVDPRTLHVTLCMLVLLDDDAIEEATRILAHAATELAPQCFRDAEWPAFRIGGWRFFPGNNVLYSPLHVDTLHGRNLVAFSDALYLRFRAAGLTAERLRRPFEPHMTLWKVSRDHAGVRRASKAMRDASGGAQRVQDALLALLTEHHAPATADAAVVFGTERLVTMELLVMREKAPDGYYRALASAAIDVPTAAATASSAAAGTLEDVNVAEPEPSLE